MSVPYAPYMPPRDTRARSVLFLATGLSAIFGIGLLVDHLGPKLDKSGPFHGIYVPGNPWFVTDVAWAVLISWPTAFVLFTGGWLWSRVVPPSDGRQARLIVAQIAAAVVLFAPFSIFIIGDVKTNMQWSALLAVPSTAFGLWVVYRMQRYHRMPVRVFLFPFAWGLFALGFGGSMNLITLQIATNQLTTRSLKHATDLHHITDQLKVQHQINVAAFASAGTFEELGKGVAIAIIYIVARHRFDGVVSGIVLGASAGLGFNLGETIEYMNAAGGATAAYQYFARQSVGLLAAHAAFTALTGAGFGIAAVLFRRRQRVLAIACGYLAAAGGHFCTDTVITWFGRKSQGWSVGSAVETWLLAPAQVLATSGPFLVLYLILWRRGLREQARLLDAAMRAEIAAGSGAISPGDASVLLKPQQRLQRRILAFRVGGLAMTRQVARLQNAQLDLAQAAANAMRGRIEPRAPGIEQLRRRALELRYEAAPYRPVPPRPQGVPA